MKLSDVRKYLLEENIEIRITPKYVDVINYREIGHFDNSNITIYHEKGSIKVKGKNLTISKLLNQEILILGNIINIEMSD